MVILNIFLITLSINFNVIIYHRKKNSDGQEETKLCLLSIFPDGEEVYNRQKHLLPCTHGRATYSFLFSNQRSDPSSVVERDYP